MWNPKWLLNVCVLCFVVAPPARPPSFRHSSVTENNQVQVVNAEQLNNQRFTLSLWNKVV